MRLKNRFPHFAMLAIILAGVQKPGLANTNELKGLLPEPARIGVAVPVEAFEVFKGEELFEPINGGAVQFLKHGFQKALYQEYIIDSTQTLQLEIYHMGEPKNSKALFEEQADPDIEPAQIGEKGILEKYYCSFWRGAYYVVVTGSDASKGSQELLLKAAQSVDEKIRKKAAD